MLGQVSLKGKLLGFSITLALFVAIVGGIGYWGLINTISDYHMVSTNFLPKVTVLNEMKASYLTVSTERDSR